MTLFKDHAFFIIDPKIVAANFPPDVHRVLVNTPIVQDRNQPDVNGATSQKPACPNPTFLPESFMLSLSPIILIRHPAEFIPSYYRASKRARFNIDVYDEDFPVNASLRWQRLFHDWYADNTDSTRSPWPIVIDADDLTNEDRIMPRVCDLAGLDPRYVQTEWERVPQATRESQTLADNIFQGALQDSTNVKRSSRRSSDINLAVERESWQQEFGPRVAEAFARYVEAAMPDYHHLRNFRL